MNEVWQAVSTLAVTGGAMALAALLGASLLIGRALRPLTAYGATLGRLRDSDYQARAEPAGSPELLDICSKINTLAEALENLSGSNQQLIRRMMDLQDDERKAIANELHDEIGPHLFAIRANATVLEKSLRENGNEGQMRNARAIGGQIELLQGHNRRILRRLRPAALDDLGLAEALQVLVKGWRESEPSVALDLDLPDQLDDCDARLSLVLYRVVQEALTNVFRHAKPEHASVAIVRHGSADDAMRTLSVTVTDDGPGMSADSRPGLGLTGMRERVRGLGGSFSYGTAPGGGAIIEAVIPLHH